MAELISTGDILQKIETVEELEETIKGFQLTTTIVGNPVDLLPVFRSDLPIVDIERVDSSFVALEIEPGATGSDFTNAEVAEIVDITAAAVNLSGVFSTGKSQTPDYLFSARAEIIRPSMSVQLLQYKAIETLARVKGKLREAINRWRYKQ